MAGHAHSPGGDHHSCAADTPHEHDAVVKERLEHEAHLTLPLSPLDW